ncbi:LuxR C-terminal-related transcriptional regulator [Clostridium sp. WILCCON 0269]|uniref:LuxR C-terminal-related transcriptional regulator n=1 Tax=Candidatus Clostridium eludens TaxID=3381663 RepID=A0ABW8SGQ4_9CLOT
MTKEYISNIGLLKTKYSVPGINKHLLPRVVINHRLEDSLSHKLTIITAPAGYGKTTAVLKWLEGISLPSAWFSIDAGDNTPFVFWSYFCAALNNISNGISQATEYIFSSQELFKANAHLSIIIDNLSMIPSDFLLVLDDFHLITNVDILNSLSYFITYLPSNMHIVMISRAEPPLKLAKLCLKEELVRVRARELRFQTKEISQYYESRGYFLQEEEIHKIECYTEGWAAALVAVALSLKDEKNRHNVISSFGSSNLYIENYLAEDVYNTWTREHQDFMEKISILDRLCGPLCEEITDYDGSRLLKELYLQNSFLVALDHEGIWFKYHPLFSDSLRKKLLNRDAASIQTLHRKAGEWFKAKDFFNEAIDHFLKGSHYEAALPLIEKHSLGLIRKGEYSNIISWIEGLPDKYVDNSLMIMLIKAAYLTGTDDFKNAWKYMERIQLAKKENTFSKTFNTTYLMVKANFFIRQGNIENTLQTIMEVAACGIRNTMNTEYMDFNLFDISIFRAPYHVFIKILKRNFAEYDSLVGNYRTLITANPGYAPLVKGELYYESGKLNEALPELLASIDEAVNARCAGALVPAMVTIAKIKRAHGDIQGALKVIEECENKVAEFHKPHWGYMLKAFKTRLYIDLNDTELIDKWMKESRLSIYQDIIKVQEYELIVLGRVLIRKQRYNDANILLNRLLSFVIIQKKNHSIVEIENLLANAALKNLNEEIAENHLKNALSIGLKEGYVRSFVDEFVPMISLLEMYLRKNKKRNKLTVYAKNLLNQTKKSVKHFVIPTNSDIIENLLTATENKVLHLIINAYTNKEIAEKLGITIRTVKAHTGNIYAKLGVKNRMQCIKKTKV